MQFTTVFIASITAIVTVNAAVLPVVNDNAEQSNVLESRSYNAPTDDTDLEKRSPQYGGNGYQQQNRGNQGWNQGGMTAPSWQNGRGPTGKMAQDQTGKMAQDKTGKMAQEETQDKTGKMAQEE
ncbi:hypothetical protein BASA50_000961 [Batrachochytrium salamandrivorans]|uniref:Uncharacterized protein n=1 Tax=Batrachochytrium salamandrivorans TaxID=1357716 RepID=A0ABQ8ET53_9FUNG|nr:hypothetical protein BASA50_000961 [Batrachochytrium salamandrivorans]